MNKIIKKIWNKSRGCFVAVSEAMTAANQCSGKAVVIGSLGLLLLANVQAADEYTHEGDYYKRDHSGPYNNTHDYTKATHMTITGSYFHLGDDSYHGNDNAFIGSTDHRGRGYATSTLDVYGNVTVTSRQDVHTALSVGWSYYPDNANGTLNVGGNVIIGGRGGTASIDLAGVGEGSDRHSVTGRLNVNGVLTIEQGGSLNLIFGGENTADGTVTASVNTKALNLYGSVVSWPGLFKNKTVIADYNYGDAAIYSGGYLATNIPVKGVETNTFNNLTIQGGGNLGNATPLILGNKTAGATTIASTLNLNGGGVGNRSALTQHQGTVNVNSGSYDFGTYTKTNGSLINRSVLSIATFNQTNGTTTNTGNLTIGNGDLNGSLNSTGTLSLTGNFTSRGNLTSSGTLNNRGNWTETNRVTIAGNLNNTGSVNFRNGFQFGNGRLTSSGTIQTNNALDIFDSLGTTGQQDLHYVALNSTVPQEVKTSLTDFFLKYVPGTVAKTLANHASFTGGKVIVTGVNLTQTQAADLTKAFKEQFFRVFAI